MFGIGAGELVIILIVLLIAVGPGKMPTLMQAVGKGLREFRRASNELRKQAGIDELLREDPLGVRSLQREIARAPAPRRPVSLSREDQLREQPPEGVDLAEARGRVLRRRTELELHQDANTDELRSEEDDAVGPLPREEESVFSEDEA